MKVTVLHDEHGQIIAVVKTTEGKPAGFMGIGMLPRKNQKVLEIELSGDLEHAPFRELHKNYHVDLHTSTLVKKKKH